MKGLNPQVAVLALVASVSAAPLPVPEAAGPATTVYAFQQAAQQTVAASFPTPNVAAVTETHYVQATAAAATTQVAPAAPAPPSTAPAAAPAAAPASSSTGSSFGSILNNFLDSSFVSNWFDFFGVGSDNSAKPDAANAAAATTSTGASDNKSFWDELFDFGNDDEPSPTAQGSSSPTSPGPSSSSAPAPTGGSSDLGPDKQFAQDMLDMHNKFRAVHDAPPLTWASKPYEFAKKMAANYDCSGVLTHSHAPDLGENLAAGYPDAKAVVQAWYDENETYTYGDETHYDHFTQVVWKSSRYLGCAYKQCGGKVGTYVVCEYDPPGNYVGESAANVLRGST
ncbi:protein Pry1p [Diutina catenulata]